MVEKRSLNLEIKAILDSEDNRRIVEGYASTWDLDSGGDEILPGAFSKSINERFTKPMAVNGKSKIKVLWQHDQEILIGKLLEISETDKGLYVKLELFNDPSFPEAEKAYKLLKMGEIFCFSIGFKIKDFEYMNVEDDDDEDFIVRLLKEVMLYEVSLVTFPMNEKAEVTNVKEKNNLMSDQAVELLKEIKFLLQQMNEKQVVEVEVKTMDSEEKAKPDLESPHTPEFTGAPVEGISDEDECKGKCPTCGQKMNCDEEKTILPEEEQAEWAAAPDKPGMGDKNPAPGCKEAEEVDTVKEVVEVKYLTLEEVKAVVNEILYANSEEITEEIVKEEKSQDPLEDFMSYLLNTKLSF